MRGTSLLLLLMAVGLPTTPSAQPVEPPPPTVESGRPFVTAFSRQDYGGGSQNWAVVQDPRGLIYVANAQGILEYDGVAWRLIQTTPPSTVRSLAVGADGRVYVGTHDDVGVLVPDSLGALQYQSLLDDVPEADRGFGNVYFTQATSAGVYFHALGRLLRWADGQIRSWDTPTQFRFSAVVRDTLYVQQHGIGLMRMVGDSLHLLPGGERFADGWMRLILPYDAETLLVGSQEDGLFLFDGTGATPFATEADAYVQEANLYLPGAVLADGTFALGLSPGGVLVIDRAGRWLRHVSRADGLPNDAVHYLSPDREGGLWLALDNGIARVETPSPVTVYGEADGLEGGVMAVRRHRGVLYAATRRGLFFLDDRTGRFSPVEGLRTQCWHLLPVGDALLVAAATGVYRVDDVRATPVKAGPDMLYQPVTLAPASWDATLVFAGLRDGLALLRTDPDAPGRWVDAGRLPGLDTQINTIHEGPDRQLWLGTSDGVARVTFSDPSVEHPVVEQFGAEQGLPSGTWGYAVADDVFFAAIDGLYRFEAADGRFVADSTFPGVVFDEALSYGSLAEGPDGSVWITSKAGAARARPQPDGTYRADTAPFRRFADKTTVAAYLDTENVVWFYGMDGLIRYDAAVLKPYDLAFPPFVRRVTAGTDSLLFAGTEGTASAPPVLPHSANSLRFDMAVPSYDGASATRYQTYLEGFDAGWSAWSPETWTSYTNLPEGAYRFRVRARNVYGSESPEATYAFTVLPPWYRTWWAYGLFSLLLIGGLVAAGRWQHRWLVRRERERAEATEAKLRAEALEAVAERNRIELEKAHELERAYHQLKATQRQLIQQEKLASLGQLTAGIAHEIKNPLNFVTNFADLNRELVDELREVLANGEGVDDILNDLKHNTRAIAQHGRRADAIVHSMMQHARTDPGERAWIPINDLVDEHVDHAFHGLQSQAPDVKVVVERDYDADAAPVYGVPQELGRVILNLLHNAFDAVRDQAAEAGDGYRPTVRVRTRQRDGWVEVAIEDNGPGIPEALREKIFEPFFTTKPPGRGTGLGLSLSYDIVTQGHGGRLSVASQEGAGSTFTLALPVDAAR